MLTYILGAGASYGVYDAVNKQRSEGISVVKLLPDELQNFVDYLQKARKESLKKYPLDTQSASFYDIIKNIISEIVKFNDEVRGQLSFDTYAKKLKLQGNEEEYNRLNAIFTCFMYFQESRFRVDKRYDGLFASILTSENGLAKLPDDLNIITWNYDIQIQRSLSSFVNNSHTHAHGSVANEFNPKEVTPTNKHRLFRLNGSILYTRSYDNQHCEYSAEFSQVKTKPNIDQDGELFLRKIIKIYSDCLNTRSNTLPYVFYSWDILSNEYLNSTLDECIKRMSSSEDIVIIGYSFPFFNRHIDKKLFSKVNEHTRIYIQDIRTQEVESSLLTVGNFKNIIPINTVDQFYIPRTYNLEG